MTSSLPRKFAALTALVLGVLMLLMGGGHLYAVTGDALAQDRPLDYRLVSLITTGGLLVLPGIVGLVCLKWL